MKFKTRSNQKELLDENEIPREELYRNLKELDFINRQLGGYKISVGGLDELMCLRPDIHNVMDIGFGGGDFIKQMALWSRMKNRNLFFYGVDYKPDCVNYAESNLEGFQNIALICSDYRDISPELMKHVDVVHCSLFLHHLSDDEITGLFTFCKRHGCSVLVNDLQRNPLAYYSIMFLTRLFSKSRLVKNDAPLSVKRGFHKKELVVLLKKSGFQKFSIRWCWAFRFKLIALE